MNIKKRLFFLKKRALEVIPPILKRLEGYSFRLGYPLLKFCILVISIFKEYFGDLELIEKSPKILIYQMGKVGSTTIAKSLEKEGFLNYQVNCLVLENIKRWKIPRTGYRDSIYIQRKLAREWTPKKWKIICLVREPIIRNISSFFQRWDSHYYYRYFKKYCGKKRTISQLKDIFIKSYPHDFPLT